MQINEVLRLSRLGNYVGSRKKKSQLFTIYLSIAHECCEKNSENGYSNTLL